MKAATADFLNREEWLRKMNPEVAMETMRLVYTAFVDNATARAGFGDFLRLLCDADGPVLFHCYHGKDRTGFAAAIILKILGVGTDCILTDYMKTVEDRKQENLERLEQYRQMGMNEEQLAGIAIAYTVQPKYLELAFEVIDAEFGSFENFLKNGLNIDQETLTKLREKYLE